MSRFIYVTPYMLDLLEVRSFEEGVRSITDIVKGWLLSSPVKVSRSLVGLLEDLTLEEAAAAKRCRESLARLKGELEEMDEADEGSGILIHLDRFKIEEN